MNGIKMSTKEVRTMLAIIESFREKCDYKYEVINTVMGSLTIKDMNALYIKLDRYYNPENYNDEI